jgi:hypothetical protein
MEQHLDPATIRRAADALLAWLQTTKTSAAALQLHCMDCDKAAIALALVDWPMGKRVCVSNCQLMETMENTSPSKELLSFDLRRPRTRWWLSHPQGIALTTLVSDGVNDEFYDLAITSASWTYEERTHIKAERYLVYAPNSNVDRALILQIPDAAPPPLRVPDNLGSFECYVCKQVPTPPWTMCASGGHIVCPEHLAQFARPIKCGICRESLATPSTLAAPFVYAHLGTMRVECGHDGCDATVALDALAAHRAKCAHGPKPCMINGCPTLVSHKAMRDHLIREHHQVPVTEPPFEVLVEAAFKNWLFPLSDKDGEFVCVGRATSDALSVGMSCTSPTPRVCLVLSYPEAGYEQQLTIDPDKVVDQSLGFRMYLPSRRPDAILSLRVHILPQERKRKREPSEEGEEDLPESKRKKETVA